jgi:hypothetical protein
MSAIYESDLTDIYDVSVMLALANHADDDGVCYPSIPRIAKLSRCRERAVYTVISRLIRRGYLERMAGGGRGNSNLYIIHTTPKPCSESTVSDDKPCMESTVTVNKPCRTNTVSDDKTLHLTTINPAPGAGEPSENRQRESRRQSPGREPDGFEEFWEICPRKEGKGAARKAYALARRREDGATLFSAMKEYAASRRGEEERYTCHPATWLNQERWNDEPIKPKAKPSGLDTAAAAAEIYRRQRGVDFGTGPSSSQPLLSAGRS